MGVQNFPRIANQNQKLVGVHNLGAEEGLVGGFGAAASYLGAQVIDFSE